MAIRRPKRRRPLVWRPDPTGELDAAVAGIERGIDDLGRELERFEAGVARLRGRVPGPGRRG